MSRVQFRLATLVAVTLAMGGALGLNLESFETGGGSEVRVTISCGLQSRCERKLIRDFSFARYGFPWPCVTRTVTNAGESPGVKFQITYAGLVANVAVWLTVFAGIAILCESVLRYRSLESPPGYAPAAGRNL